MTRGYLVPAKPEAMTIDIGHTALLVIDMQNSLCKNDGLPQHYHLGETEPYPAIYPIKTFGPDIDADDLINTLQ